MLDLFSAPHFQQYLSPSFNFKPHFLQNIFNSPPFCLWASAQYLTEIPVEQSINVGGQEMSVDEAEDGNSEQVPEKSQSEEVNQVQQMQEWMQSEEGQRAQQQMQEWMQSEEGQQAQQQVQDMLNSMMNQ